MTSATSKYRSLRAAFALGGCWTSPEVVTASVPNDYRQRHPIAVQEGNHSIVVFVGAGRGGLFRSQDFVNNETELMVLVTPFVVRAVAQQELSRPDDGFAPANDSQSTLLARINRIYGVAARVETGAGHPGYFGFIID